MLSPVPWIGVHFLARLLLWQRRALAAREVHTLKVGGSIPSAATSGLDKTLSKLHRASAIVGALCYFGG